MLLFRRSGPDGAISATFSFAHCHRNGLQKQGGWRKTLRVNQRISMPFGGAVRLLGGARVGCHKAADGQLSFLPEMFRNDDIEREREGGYEIKM